MRNFCVAVVFLLAFASAAYAQSTGTINGRVTDPSGGVVPGATVTATNAGTGIARSTVTDSDGLYTIPELTPGTYNVKAAVGGFATLEKQGETLLTATTLTVNLELGLASTASKVEVTSEAPLVELTQSVVSDTLQATEVQNLPILNRNFSGLITLLPSARPTATPANNKISLGGGIGFGGGAGRNGAAEVDGMALRDDVNGGPLFNVTLEGVQEFNVVAHDYPAQYGLTAGGIVLITTKSGSNQFHGSAFGFGRDQDLTAIDYLSETAHGGPGAKPPYSREEFGGSIGGPIIKDKLFFFGAVEDVRLDQSITVPNGPTNDWVTQAQQVKTYLMSSSVDAQCSICSQIGSLIGPTAYAPETIRDLMASARVDYQISSHHSLFARYLGEYTSTYNDILQTLGGAPHPDYNATSSNVYDPIRTENGVLSETWVLGNGTVNTLAVAGTHFYEFQSCNCTLTGATEIYRNIVFPDFSLGAPVPSVNSENLQTDVQIKDIVAHQAGSHALKFGGDFINYPYLGYLRNISGNVTFFADPSTILNPANAATYPDGLLTPGAMKSIVVGTQNFGGAPALSGIPDGKEFSLFLQDDWKVRPTFTLNLGVHYDQFVNFYDESNQQYNLSRYFLEAIGNSWGAPVHPDKSAYSPRVGFAWDLTGNGKSVVRASFGLFYDESLSPNMTAIDPLAQPLLENVQSTFTNTSVGVGPAATTVYGGSLPAVLQPGLPNFLYTGGNITSSLVPGGNSTLTWLEPGMSDPYNEQIHGGFTRQLTSNTVISIDFTHILGVHELHAQLINPTESTAWDPDAAAYETCASQNISPITNKPVAVRRLSCAFNALGLAPGTVGVVQINSTTNRSQYNEMIVHFEKRSRVVDFQANYILSSAYAFGGAIGSTATGGGPVGAMIPFQWFTKTEWGPTLTDERNRVVLSGVFKLPWGIQVSPVFQYGGARPYNCLSGTDWTGSGGGDTRCLMYQGQFVPVPQPLSPGVAVGGVLPAGNTVVPVNYLRGTATYDLDARIQRSFKLAETKQIDGFVELYNITNRANFGNNYSGTCTANTAKTACTSSFESVLGYFNNGYSLPISFQVQLGARFTF